MDYAVNIMDYLIICYCFASLSCLLIPIGLIIPTGLSNITWPMHIPIG